PGPGCAHAQTSLTDPYLRLAFETRTLSRGPWPRSTSVLLGLAAVLELFVDDLGEAVDRQSTRNELAVHEEGRSRLHADLLAVRHVFLNVLSELMAVEAFL